MAFDFSKITSAVRSSIQSKDTDSVIGIDIGSASIKVVQLRNKEGVPTLDTYGELQLGPYGDVEVGRATTLSQEKLVQALGDIISESGASSKNAALTISFNSSFMTLLSFPKEEMNTIDTRIAEEAKKYIPVSLSELVLDWFPMATTNESPTQKILLAAIRKDVLQNIRFVTSSTGLTELLAEIETFSLIRSCVSAKDTTVAIVDLGASSTKVSISKQGSLQKTHSLRMSGSELTTVLSEKLSVPYDEAEVLKRRTGLLGSESDSRVQKELTPILERGFKEVLTVIKRYADEEKTTVEKVVLTGGGALLKGLDGYAKEMLGKPVVIADPFEKVAYPVFLEKTLKEAGPAFAVSVGVALRGLTQE